MNESDLKILNFIKTQPEILKMWEKLNSAKFEYEKNQNSLICTIIGYFLKNNETNNKNSINNFDFLYEYKVFYKAF